jgi:ABC-type antimicrobial peptide transport system permease subunit
MDYGSVSPTDSSITHNTQTENDTIEHVRVLMAPKELERIEWREYLKWPVLKKQSFSLLQRWYQYLIYTLRDTAKRKVSFCIGLASCFIVVWMILLAMTVLYQVPLIFMRLAETQAGEFDLRIKANPYVKGQSLNYHAITQALKKTNSTFQNSAPRMIFGDVSVSKLSSCNVDVNTTQNAWEWMYLGNVTSTCGKRAESRTSNDLIAKDYNDGKYCVLDLCDRSIVGSGVQMIAYDTDLEKKMGFGRRWNLPAAPKGQAYITGGLSFTLGVGIGDTIIITIPDTVSTLIGPYRDMGMIDSISNYDLNHHLRFNKGLIHVPFVVRDVIIDYAGKIESGLSDALLVDFGTFAAHISEFLPPQIFTPAQSDIMKRTDLYKYAQYVYVNHDPAVRLQVYNNNDYGKIQARVTSFATRVLYNIGYNQVNAEFPILSYMRGTRFFAMFLGLIISIIVTILTILSIILIYSLLMISVESKQFEMGVLRMIGMTRSGLVQLILLQAFIYAVPAWVVGMLLGQVSYVGVSYILSRTLQLEELSRWVTLSAVAIATAVGIIVPVVSSILPIMTALGQNLTDSLDTNRSKTKAVKYSIDRASEGDISAVPIVLGMALAILGFGVYYFFPLSLLTFNITFLLYMFFGLILAMLFGLILLSLNLENIISMFVTVLFFFWENVAVREIVLKNLVAHRERNRKTSIMFALSLGFIIFISVSVDLQLSTVRYNTIRQAGTRLQIRDGGRSLQRLSLQREIEKFLNANKNLVPHYAYMGYELRFNDGTSQPAISNMGNYKEGYQRIHAVSAGFWDTTGDKFLRIKSQPNAPTPNGAPAPIIGRYLYSWGLGEQLYTLRVTSLMILGGTFLDMMGLNVDSRFLFTITYNTERFPKYTYKMLQPLVFLAASPALTFSVFPLVANQDAAVSFPTFLRLANGTFSSIRDIPVQLMFVKTPDDIADSDLQYVKKELQRIVGPFGSRVFDVEDELRPLNIASQVMEFFFIFTTAVAMAICFFSLVSSMYSNVNEQAKEIGILRAIGTRKFTIIRIFVYESFVLIMSASITGMFIGAVVGYTMNLQNALFTELPIDFVFPWSIVGVVFGLAVLFGLFASLFPVLTLLQLPVVTILRRLVT